MPLSEGRWRQFMMPFKVRDLEKYRFPGVLLSSVGLVSKK